LNAFAEWDKIKNISEYAGKRKVICPSSGQGTKLRQYDERGLAP
jgi:hypothetical protein